MDRPLLFRVLVDLALAVAVMQGWWLVALGISIVGLWSFSYFAEALIAGFAFDSLFGWVPGYGIWGHIGVIASAILSIASAFFKKSLRK